MKLNKIEIFDKNDNIVSNSAPDGIKIEFAGDQNIVRISSQCRFSNCHILLGSSTKVEIKDSIHQISCLNILGKRSLYGEVRIGQNFSCVSSSLMLSGNSKVYIGNDCMFNSNIFCWASDFHAIVDALTKETVNYNNECGLYIGNHVWVSENARILKNAFISDNTVVANSAVVGKKFEKGGVILAGNPANIVRQGIDWKREAPDSTPTRYVRESDHISEKSNIRRENWALITGAIRSELYLKMILLKACKMREIGVIEEIILSTWSGEIDKYVGLRQKLNTLNIHIVESPTLIDDYEVKFNHIVYARTRHLIMEGLKRIPSGKFVIKLRTDFLEGVDRFLNVIQRRDLDLSVKKYGEFAPIFEYKIVQSRYEPMDIIWANDRFFYGYKNDIEKICIPLQGHRFAMCRKAVEIDLIFGYAFWSNALLRNVWDLLPEQFYTALISFVKANKSIVLPRILYRVYATALIFVYCNILYIDDFFKNKITDDISFADIFTNKISTNREIKSLLTKKEAFKCESDEIFYQELMNISLGLPNSKIFSYTEYEELKKFVVEQMKRPELINPYLPLKNKSSVSDEVTVQTLFSDYINEQEKINQIIGIAEHFDSMAQIFEETGCNDNSKLSIDIIKAAIFDRGHSKACYQYLKLLNENSAEPDMVVIMQIISVFRRFAFRRTDYPTKYVIAGFYLLLVVLKKLFIENPELEKKYHLKGQFFNILGEFKESFIAKKIKYTTIYNYEQEQGLVKCLIKYIDKKVKDDNFTQFECGVLDALLILGLPNAPITDNVKEYLKRNHSEVLTQFVLLYGDSLFDISNIIISENLKQIIFNLQHADKRYFELLLKYSENCLNSTEASYVSKLILSEKYNYSPDTWEQADKCILELYKNYKLQKTLPYNANFCNDEQKLLINPEDAFIETDGFICTLKILSKKKILDKNKDILYKFFDDVQLDPIKMMFERIEKDSRISFFSLKNENEFWVNYVPFSTSKISKFLTIPKNEKNNMTWPYSETGSFSPYAAYLCFRATSVVISIEFAADNCAQKTELIKHVNNILHLNLDASQSILRLQREIFSYFKSDICSAINSALDLFCEIGDILVSTVEDIIDNQYKM